MSLEKNVTSTSLVTEHLPEICQKFELSHKKTSQPKISPVDNKEQMTEETIKKTIYTRV